MAYLRTPIVGGIDETYIDVIVQDLDYPANTYTKIDIICLNTGQRYDVRFNSGAGGSPGTYRTGQQRFSGLTPGTTYYFYAETTYGGGSRRIPDSGYMSQATYDNTPPAPYGVSISQYSLTGKEITVEVTWSGSAHTIEFDFSWQGSLVDYSESVSTSGAFLRRTFTVPNYSTSYWIDVRLRGDGGTTSWARLTFTSGAAPIVVGTPSITSLSNFKSNAITVNWSAASNAWYYEVQYKKTTTSVWSYAAYSQSGTSFEVAGLDPSTDYQFRVRGYQGNTFGSWSSSMTGRTLSNIPSAFNWTYAKNSGGAYNLTANEWNALAAKINQFRSYKGLADYTFDTAYTGNIFYVYMANQARNAINTMSPSYSPPAVRYANDIVEAAVLNRLRDSLNSVS